MPLIQPPSSDLPPTTPTYIHAYESIIKRVREDPGRMAGGVVIFAGVDLVSVRVRATLPLQLSGAKNYHLREPFFCERSEHLYRLERNEDCRLSRVQRALREGYCTLRTY
jgi:hypothetical protein